MDHIRQPIAAGFGPCRFVGVDRRSNGCSAWNSKAYHGKVAGATDQQDRREREG